MTSEEFMRDVWKGPDTEALACRKALDALGGEPEGNRLRDLLALIVLTFRRHQGVAWSVWPAIVGPEGDPVTPEMIAAAVGWPQDRIDADFDKLVAVGLLRYADPE